MFIPSKAFLSPHIPVYTRHKGLINAMGRFCLLVNVTQVNHQAHYNDFYEFLPGGVGWEVAICAFVEISHEAIADPESHVH